MNRGQRIIAAVTAIALLFAGAVGAFVFSGNGDASPQTAHAQGYYENRGISVHGEGQVSVTPDIARILVGVELQGSDLDEIRDEADTRMNDVIDALEEMGIPSEDIRTIAYDIWVQDEPIDPRPILEDPIREEEVEVDEPEFEEPEAEEDDTVTDDAVSTDDDDAVTPDDNDDAVTDDDDDAVMTDEEGQEEVAPEVGVQSYTLAQLVEVRITDIDMVGDVINTALDAGANRVGSISFEVEDRQAAIQQAREIAVEEARSKGEHLAELTGVTLGPPLRIEESSPSGPVVQFDEMAAMEDEMAADAGARIEPGQQIIWVSVYITYDIE
jgi:uncharacterized protein YggE